MNKGVAVASIMLCAGLAWLGLRGGAHEPAGPATSVTASSRAAAAPFAPASRALPAPPLAAANASAPVASRVAGDAPVPAAVSMAQARRQGDERAPPIDPPDPAQAALAPTPWDLSDPARYRDYEQRQQRQVRAAYLRAAQDQLPRWRAALAEARARGLPPEDIAAAEEKIRRLEAAQSMLRASEAER
jgi:hypothetical protein